MSIEKNEIAIKEKYSLFIGKTIESITPLTQQEMDELCWYDGGDAIPMVIRFTDGHFLIPSADPEGNGPGHLFTGEYV